MRKEVFANGEYYHVYNRGVDKRKIFYHAGQYVRFINTVTNLLDTGSATESNSIKDTSLALSKKLSFICYCLMPNHYHFILKQKMDNGISEFMHKLNTSYTKYFNISSKRSGRLFEYTFKARHIESENILLHISRYIHLNPLIADITNNLRNYKWSSYPYFINIIDSQFCDKNEILMILSNVNSGQKYEHFVTDQIDYARELDGIKHLLME